MDGSSLNSVFAQRVIWSMAVLAHAGRHRSFQPYHHYQLALTGAGNSRTAAAGRLFAREKFSDEFRDWYFLPMMGCIWSCPPTRCCGSVATMIRFCHNHGLIRSPTARSGGLSGRRRYVEDRRKSRTSG
jgi:predicted NAD/FAD-binding protein